MHACTPFHKLTTKFSLAAERRFTSLRKVPCLLCRNAVRIMSRRRSNMKKHVSFKLNKLCFSVLFILQHQAPTSGSDLHLHKDSKVCLVRPSDILILPSQRTAGSLWQQVPPCCSTWTSLMLAPQGSGHTRSRAKDLKPQGIAWSSPWRLHKAMASSKRMSRTPAT